VFWFLIWVPRRMRCAALSSGCQLDCECRPSADRQFERRTAQRGCRGDQAGGDSRLRLRGLHREEQTVDHPHQRDSLQSRLKLDVHVTTTPELQMQTAIARLSGTPTFGCGNGRSARNPGRVEVLEGEISFNGTKYKLERGDVTFSNPRRPSRSSI